MPFPLRLTLAAAAVAAIFPAAAQQTPPPAPKEPAAKVEVKGNAEAYDPRRDDTASKIVVNHDELVKYGDTNVLDALKRIPGVTVSGAAGRPGGEIRMRGLGGGYTQILINGERAPAGFSMDALAPDMIERIEVLRSASAEFSTQSIAGTINIVLRKAIATAQRELKLGFAGGQGMRAPNANLTMSDTKGRMSYSVIGSFNDNRYDRGAPTLQEFFGPGGELTTREQFRGRMKGVFRGGGLNPRINWSLENGDTVTSQTFMHVYRANSDLSRRLEQVTGLPLAFQDSDTHSESDGESLRTDLNWVHKLGDSAKLDVKIGASYNKNGSLVHRIGHASPGNAGLDSTSDANSHGKGVTSTGKFSKPIMEGHALALGWDGGLSRRSETSVETGMGPARTDRFSARVGRLALYGQDEWSLTPRLSVYLGARWEGIETVTTGSTFDRSSSRLSVWSPLAQVLYKLPNSKSDQLRFALTRTFKAPDTSSLVPRRFRSTNNSAIEPDYQGNPDLKPELATGLDASYEHYFLEGGVFSVAASSRRITDFTRRDVVLASDGRWISLPVNDGTAQTRSLEVEAKFPLKVFVKDAPALDLRASVSRNWSSVDAVPGPNNRLDQQTPMSATFGLDYKHGPLTTGGSFNFRNGGPVRISASQSSYQTVRRDMEFYGLWKFTPKTQFRLTINNVLAQDWISENFYQTESGSSHLRTVYPGTMFVRATLEMKF